MEREYGHKTARMLFGGQECFKESHEKYVRKLLDDAQADIERARRIRTVIRDRTQGDGRASS